MPLVVGFILGPVLEQSLRRALLLSRGDLTVFVQRPISAVLVMFAAGLLLVAIVSAVRFKPASLAIDELPT